MAKHEGVFDSLYSSMVRAGEAGGILDTVLTRLAAFREKAAAIRATVRGAMIYPMVILTVAMAVLAAVITWVIPKFREIFDSFGVDLPGPTEALLSLSDVFVEYWYLVFGLPVVIAFLHLGAMRRGGAYRYRIHGLLLKVPGLGVVLSNSIIAGFARIKEYVGNLQFGLQQAHSCIPEIWMSERRRASQDHGCSTSIDAPAANKFSHGRVDLGMKVDTIRKHGDVISKPAFGDT